LIPEVAGLPMAGWGVDVMGAAFRGELRVDGRGAEQRFALAQAPERVEDGMVALLRAYLRGYGPATERDFAYWVGLPLRDILGAFAALRPELDEVGGGYMLSGSEIDVPSIPRALLLAKFDPLTMGHADKTRWLDPTDQARVFRKAAQVEAVVLLEGRAAATWRVARKANRAAVTVEPFRNLRPPERNAIERSAQRLGASIGWGEGEVTFVRSD
ncbi:hypothetical protein EON82_17895, partial [bacterium]